MSDLFPKIAASQLNVKRTEIGEANNLAVVGDYLYGICNKDSGSFWICDIHGEFACNPKKISEISGLGNTRQIKVSNSAVSGKTIAAITARECGLYLIDVSVPESPEIMCHYNTTEFATGVAFYSNYLFISCRSFGVEIVDVSDPYNPKHCSVFEAGEVQSLTVDNGILYLGSWWERRVDIFDVRDVHNPSFINSVPLQGRGDGVTVKNGLLYAAMGQHRPPASGKTPTEYGYGRGNGFCIWDVSDLSSPKQLSCTFLPHQYYCCNFDMWNVTLCDNYAILSHTFNGVWIYDVTSPENPILVDHTSVKSEYKMEEMIDVNETTTKIRPMVFPFDPKTDMRAPVCGIAVSDKHLYIACRFANLHVAKGPYFTDIKAPTGSLSASKDSFYFLHPGNEDSDIIYKTTLGQAHAAILYNDMVWVACGMDGIRTYSPKDLEPISHTPMNELCADDAFAMDIRVIGDLFVIAAAKAGILLCRASGGKLVCISRCDTSGKTCAQAVPSENGRFVIAHCGDQHMAIADISNTKMPKIVLWDKYEPGLLYHRQLTYNGVDGRYYGCFWQGNLTHWYDLGGETPEIVPDWNNGGNDFFNGITGTNMPNTVLGIRTGGYIFHDIREDIRYSFENVTKLESICLKGKPNLKNNILCVSNRSGGDVVICDVSDRTNPKLIRKIHFSGHPDIGCFTENGIVIPLGHQGIALITLIN